MIAGPALVGVMGIDLDPAKLTDPSVVFVTAAKSSEVRFYLVRKSTFFSRKSTFFSRKSTFFSRRSSFFNGKG